MSEQGSYRRLVRNLRKAAEQKEADMTIPKKGSRAIEVKGRKFRWQINADVHRLTVEDATSKKIEQQDLDPKFAVTPSYVEKFILERFVRGAAKSG